MQFIVTGYDGKDAGAPARRMAVREEHLKGARQMYLEKKALYLAALVDEEEKMIGSVMIMDFPSEEALRDEWLSKEPYVTGGVWVDVKVEACKVPPFCR